MTAIVGLHHVQVACPAGSEDTLRQFYGQVLDMAEVPKPPVLAARGGVWFSAGSCEIHCGVEDPFTAAHKAHPGIAVSDVDALALAVGGSGAPVDWDDNLPGLKHRIRWATGWSSNRSRPDGGPASIAAALRGESALGRLVGSS